MARHINHLIIALLAGVLLGLLLAKWLDAQTEPEPPAPKPPKGRYYDNITPLDADQRDGVDRKATGTFGR